MRFNEFRQTLTEARGHLDHPEDLVFTEGAGGAIRAVKAIDATATNPGAITIKWDGYPALIFGRDLEGNFSIMDKHMFNRRDGSGRQVFSPEQFLAYDQARGADRSDLAGIIARIWPTLEASVKTPGYYWGDFLFGAPLKAKKGVYTFRANPNGITYQVDADSDVGQLLKDKQAGIAVHSYIPATAASTDDMESLNGTLGGLKNTGDIALVPSKMPETPKIKINTTLREEALTAIKKHGAGLDELLTPPAGTKSKYNSNLFTVYINKRIVEGNIGNVDDLFNGFVSYYHSRSQGFSPAIKAKVDQHIRDNQTQLRGAFVIWSTVYNLKSDIVKQLDIAAKNSPVRGYLQDGTQTQEGFVSQGIKFVDRMGFSRQNLAARATQDTAVEPESESRNVVVVFGGGFQPWSPQHTNSFNQALAQFKDVPGVKFYIASSDVQSERPLSFAEKEFLIRQAGITAPVVQERTPLNPINILNQFNPDRDVFVLVRSAKDPLPYTKKDGSPGYYQPFTSLDNLSDAKPFNNAPGAGGHGYVFVPAVYTGKILGQPITSASQIRQMYADADDKTRTKIIRALYPAATEPVKIKQIFDQKFGTAAPAQALAPAKAAKAAKATKAPADKTQKIQPDSEPVMEGDPPNWYQGSTSAIPGTPNSLRPQPTKADILKFRRQQRELMKFLGRK